MSDKIDVENFTSPGKTFRVDAAKYTAMRDAIMKVTPNAAPGCTNAEMKQGVLPHLPDALFPAGATAGWWIKCVQLDLEAKGIMSRTKTSPLRYYLT